LAELRFLTPTFNGDKIRFEIDANKRQLSYNQVVNQKRSTLYPIILIVLATAALFWVLAIRRFSEPNNPIPMPLPPVQVNARDDYSDVLLIINTKSSSSNEIGSYFASARKIPSVNVLYVNTTTSEEINDAEFQNLRSQIESYILSNNLTDKINYIVTTKGLPLKINRYALGSQWDSNYNSSASVDSELTLILSKDSPNIGGPGNVRSKYYLAGDQFSEAKYDMYLVSRLDGYTVDQVKALIDRAANPVPFASTTKFVLDEDPIGVLSLNETMARAAQELQGRGFNVLLDTTNNFITNQKDVIGYVSYGSNDHNATSPAGQAIPHNTWHNGAIAITYVSTSGRTFNWPPSYGQSLIADIIAEGVTGAEGYVYEPFASGMADVSVLFDRFMTGYNLAESFYAASPYLSWMDVIIGDPKATIETQQ
jgi:uncharacterized protein (TIGR03790 family)